MLARAGAKFGFKSTATAEAEGTICSSPRRFSANSVGEDVDTGRIAVGSGEAGNEPSLDRIAAAVEHYGDRCRRSLGSSSGRFAADRDDDGDLAANEIGSQRRHSLVVALGPAVLDRDIVALDEAGFLETFTEAGDEMREWTGRSGTEEPDHRHPLLLCVSRERPCDRRAAEKSEELAPLHVPSARDHALRLSLALCDREARNETTHDWVTYDWPNVRFWSKANICAHVCFTPKSGHLQCTSACPLRLISGHSMISSARKRKGPGIDNPMAFAAFKLITN